MARTSIEETDGTVTLGTGWATIGAGADTQASGGNFAFATTSAKTVTIAVAGASGYTGFVVRFCGRSDSTRNATIQIDSGPVVAMDQGGIITTGSVNTNYTIYRQLAGPYSFVGNGAHTIIITSGTGTTTFDGIEFFTAETSTVDEVLGFGHSWMWSVINGSSATQNTQRVNLLVANYLRSTEVNHGMPAEALTNGDYRSASPFIHSRYYNQRVILTPGWMRAESGPSWPSPGPAMGAGALLTTTQTGNFGPQWWARKPRVALVMHGVNDGGYTTIYDTPGFTIPDGSGTPPSNTVDFRDAALHNTSPGASAVAFQTPAAMRGGYGLASFFQRMCELQMRMQLNSPLTETYYFGVGPTNSIDSGNLTPSYSNGRYFWWKYSDAIREMTQLPWVRNAYYVDILGAMTNRGGSTLFGSDNGHPNNAGNVLMFEEWKRIYEAVHQTGGMAASRVA